MKKYFHRLPKRLKALIKSCRKIARRLDCNLYLVGGFIRDLILGVENFDLDFTVEADGLNFAKHLADELKGSLVRHQRFGTATVVTPDRIKIDIATARRETYKSRAALPVVSPGDIRDDLRRRDFTINAMALRIYPQAGARPIDFFNGQGDIVKKKIEILHGLSFIDDPTRILRAIRFEQRYNFKIGKDTLKMLREAVAADMLNIVNPHRLKNEIILIFKEAHPLKCVKRMQELGCLSFISPGLKLNRQKVNLLRSISGTINRFKKDFPQHRSLDLWLMYFIALTAELKIKDIQAIFRKFAFSRGETRRALSYKKILKHRSDKKLKRRLNATEVYRLLEPLSYEVILLMQAGSKNKILRKNINDFFTKLNGMRPLASGKDLAGLGIAAGPVYSRIFKRLLYARLQGKINSKEEELRFVQKLVRR